MAFIVTKVENSSNIVEYAYDEAKSVLRIKFASGKQYDYLEVAPDTVQSFADAESKGSFFAQVIKPDHLCQPVK